MYLCVSVIFSFVSHFVLHIIWIIDVLDTMFTSGIATQVDDVDRETFDSVLMSTFLLDVIIDRPSTYGNKDIDAFGSRNGPSW